MSLPKGRLHIKNSISGENRTLVDSDNALRNYHSFMSDSSGEQPLTIQNVAKGIHGRMIRTGSFILAETGERRARASNDTSIEDLERQPLLSGPLNQDGRPSIRQRIRKGYQHTIGWFYDNNLQFVLKCSFAYALASLAVYNPYFSSFLGKSDSKHAVATVAVYFHPSRTFGSMHQSILFAFGAIVYSFGVSILSTAIASSFYSAGYEILGILTNLTFFSASLGCVSYMKQKMSHPTFNVACSLAAISLVSAIVKEGSQDPDNIPFWRFYFLLKIVCSGCLISILCCYLLVPTSAVKQLKKELNNSCTLMSQYLLQIEKAFINGNNINADAAITALNQKIKSNSTSLTKLLDEAKYELFLIGKEKEYEVFGRLVKSAKFMESQLGGLKGSAEMQWSTMHADQQSKTNTNTSTCARSIRTIDSDQDDFDNSRYLTISESTVTLDDDIITALDSSQLFDIFIHYLGPSMKSFCYTIRGVLDGMPFEEIDDYPTRETYHYSASLRLASDLFERKYAKAMAKLYKQNIFKKETPLETKVDEEEVAASCGNFASILAEYSKELDKFIQLLAEYSEVIEDKPKSWNFLINWSGSPAVNKDKFPDLDYAIQQFNITLQKRTESTDQEDTLGYKIWEFVSFFRKVEVQFGIRVGLGAFVLASLAYFPGTKEAFMEWRGEWVLVTYGIVMNKSLGGTTMTMNWRFLGTFLGAFMAFLLWTLFDANVYVMFFGGWIISLFSFNIILNWKDVNAYGRFILLTYNITALYSYNIKKSEDLELGDDTDPIIRDIAIHRFFGIALGVLWALFMTVTFLPMTARRRLKKGLSILWLRLGVVWNTDPLEVRDNVLVGLADPSGINSIMRELEVLLKQAPKETRLKGKFREDIYNKLVKSTEKIIDAFQNINTMISVEPTLSENESLVLNYTKQERDELTNRIFLIFYMISSSLTLGIPLPSKPASTDHSRDRIMVKLGNIRSEKLLKDEDYVLLYSYVLVSNVITNELNKIIELLGDLYGLVDEETFEL